MTCQSHSLADSSILIHRRAESPSAGNGDLGESLFFWLLMIYFCSIDISIVLDLEDLIIKLLRATISLMVANRSSANMESGLAIRKSTPSFYPSNYLKNAFLQVLAWTPKVLVRPTLISLLI